MKAYLLQAPRDFVEAGIPKGYMLQVISDRTSGPDFTEVREALKRAGFTSTMAESFASPGNWIVKEL